MLMPNNTVKYEVFVKQYLDAILDISGFHLTIESNFAIALVLHCYAL